METILSPLSTPIAITTGFTQTAETSITMRCHDRVFNDVEIRDESDELLFTVESKGAASWSWRRIVKDTTGTPLFHFRKFFNLGINRNWGVEDPNTGRELCTMEHVTKILRKQHAVDVVVRRDDGKEEKVEVRPRDQSGLTVLVNVRGALVAEIDMVEVNWSRKRDRSVWKATVAGGVDLALVRLSYLSYRYMTITNYD
jgi:LURP-one-related